MFNRFKLPPGMRIALLSAILFGVSTPLAKLFLNDVSPAMTAGLLYTSSGLGLRIVRNTKRIPGFRLNIRERYEFLLAVLCGGVLAPVSLFYGLSGMESSGASILLNLESVFTALIAWFIFKENFDKKIIIGMMSIVLGAFLIGWDGNFNIDHLLSTLLIVLASFLWAVDNNLTRNVISADTLWLASTKGLIAGPINLLIAISMGASFPKFSAMLGLSAVGIASFGISLVLFVNAMRLIGTSRAGAIFSVAPFFGAVVAVVLGDPLTWQLAGAGLLMGIGIYFHIVDDHHHEHAHAGDRHSHAHFPDVSHRHH